MKVTRILVWRTARKRIIDEEGWRALYRAWWITLLGTFSSGIAY